MKAFKKIPIAFLVVLILVGGGLGTSPEMRLNTCWLFSTSKTVQSVPSPDGSMILHVGQMSCGHPSLQNIQFYDCKTFINLETQGGSFRRGFEWLGECNITVKWLGNITFEITNSKGSKRMVEIYDFFNILP